MLTSQAPTSLSCTATKKYLTNHWGVLFGGRPIVMAFGNGGSPLTENLGQSLAEVGAGKSKIYS